MQAFERQQAPCGSAWGGGLPGGRAVPLFSGGTSGAAPLLRHPALQSLHAPRQLASTSEGPSCRAKEGPAVLPWAMSHEPTYRGRGDSAAFLIRTHCAARPRPPSARAVHCSRKQGRVGPCFWLRPRHRCCCCCSVCSTVVGKLTQRGVEVVGDAARHPLRGALVLRRLTTGLSPVHTERVLSLLARNRRPGGIGGVQRRPCQSGSDPPSVPGPPSLSSPHHLLSPVHSPSLVRSLRPRTSPHLTCFRPSLVWLSLPPRC